MQFAQPAPGLLFEVGIVLNLDKESIQAEVDESAITLQRLIFII